MNGVSVQIDRLYPAVHFPVSQGISISPLIKWNHEKDWPTLENKTQDRLRQIQKTIFINSSDDKYKFIDGNRINGKLNSFNQNFHEKALFHKYLIQFFLF